MQLRKFKKKTPASDSIKYAHLSYQKTEILLKN